MSFFGIKGAFFSKTTRWICTKFFSGFRENTCSLQPALKSSAPGFKSEMDLQLCLKHCCKDN